MSEEIDRAFAELIARNADLISLPDGQQPDDDDLDEIRLKLVSGAAIFTAPPRPDAIWGLGDEILWADGQALVVFGPDGTGKTTLAGNMLRARLGITDKVLGFPVMPGERNILYLAMDRPAQALSNMRRLFRPEHEKLVTSRVAIWKGPPLRDFATDTRLLARMCRAADADTCFIDSIKDGAIGISKDEVGGGWNRARQEALVCGVQVFEMNHPRKAQVGNARPDKLDDQYGSAWIGRGAGSIISLWGQAGDPIIEVNLRKPVIQQVPTIQMLIDDSGELSVSHDDEIDLVAQTLARGSAGMTVTVAAQLLFGSEDRNAIEKARRRLQGLERKGLLTSAGGKGGPGGGGQVTWFGVDRHTRTTFDHAHESGTSDS